MNDTHDRTIPLASAPNLRDLGGIPTEHGTVKRGVLYRSATLSSLTDIDQHWFATADVRTVYDLRTADEAAASPDNLPAGTMGRNLDVLADSPTSVAAGLAELAADPGAFASTLANGRGEALFEETYRDLVRMPSAVSAYRSFFLSLIDGDRQGAALFHCTTGKDRTGWAAASVLSLLGADIDDVYDDYLQTNTDLLPALEPLLQQAEAHGVEREVLLPVLGVRESYLAAAFAEVDERFGGMRTYAAEGLGLTDEEIHALSVLLT